MNLNFFILKGAFFVVDSWPVEVYSNYMVGIPTTTPLGQPLSACISAFIDRVYTTHHICVKA